MKRSNRTKENPSICVNYYKRGPRRVCFWIENGKQRQEYYSRWLWEKQKGDIPKNFFVHHKDKNTLNDCIENYELMSRSEHSRFHCKKDISELSVYGRLLKQHAKLDYTDKGKYKYLSRWKEIDGESDYAKLKCILSKYDIKNFQQLSEMSNIDFGQLSRIRHNKCKLGWININRLFNFLDKC